MVATPYRLSIIVLRMHPTLAHARTITATVEGMIQ